MGQSNSLLDSRGESLSEEFDFIHEQIRKHSLTLRQLSLLTYDDLHTKIAELNAMSSKYVDRNGKQLLFEVKPGTDTHVLWKAKCVINCIKLDPNTQKVEKSRELYLKQFLQVYNTIASMKVTVPISPSSRKLVDNEAEGESKDTVAASTTTKADSDILDASHPLQMFSNMNASMILDTVAPAKDSEDSSGIDECCICMDSRSQVSLPCSHSYCLACIEQWNVDHETCPICREKFDPELTYDLLDFPNQQELNDSIQKTFSDLTL